MAFEPVGLGKKIFQERYAIHAEETWQEACKRVATWAASCEDRDKIGLVSEQFERILSEGLFMPAGRIWYAAGRPFAQGLNCFVLGVGDSREEMGAPRGRREEKFTPIPPPVPDTTIVA